MAHWRGGLADVVAPVEGVLSHPMDEMMMDATVGDSFSAPPGPPGSTTEAPDFFATRTGSANKSKIGKEKGIGIAKFKNSKVNACRNSCAIQNACNLFCRGTSQGQFFISSALICTARTTATATAVAITNAFSAINKSSSSSSCFSNAATAIAASTVPLLELHGKCATLPFCFLIRLFWSDSCHNDCQDHWIVVCRRGQMR